MTRPPAGLSALHPAWLLATWFGAGLVPKAPGTLASFVALPFAWFIQTWFGAPGLLAAGVAAFCVGCWACGPLLTGAAHEDPSHIVIDEVAGQWLTLAMVAFAAEAPEPLFYATGFILFRAFDIMKPWPISWSERRFSGALGIMIDDVLAAVFAGAGTVFIFAFAHHLGPFSS